MERIFRSDPAIIKYLQTVIGYALTSSANEQMAIILYGLGENGKTTFIETAMALFGVGEYSVQTSFEVFLSTKFNNDGPNPGLAMLKGARLVTASESESGRKLNESLLKHVTGNGTITTRLLYKDPFSFEPQFQLFLDTNNKPVIRDQTHAMWRRIRLVPFVETITSQEKILDLGDRLRAEELPGILNWALEGYRIYREQGLVTPGSVTAATSDYRTDEDPLGEFLSTCCLLEEGASQPSGLLFQAYRNWCESMGPKALDSRWFGQSLAQQGINREARSKSSRGSYIGIRLRKVGDDAIG